MTQATMSQNPVTSTPLPKCKKVIPFSSTPYTNLGTDLFDQFISPIALSNYSQEALKPPQTTVSKVEKAPVVLPVPKKRKQSTKVTESVSSKVLKELGHVPVSLSCSRNRFYMYPEPVILESDEECDVAPNIVKNLSKQEHKAKPTKQKKTPHKRNTEKATKPLKQKHSENKIETSPSVVILDEEEDLFSSVILLKNIKGKDKKISIKENIIEEKDSIKWTPRKLRIRKIGIEDENLDEPVQAVPQNAKSKIPIEYISNFKDVVFKHNKHSGGVVASCLETPGLKLGYIEIVKGKCFIGKSSDITFTMIEGTIEASLLKSSVTLSAGDMLHVPGPDTKYELKSTTEQARLHYVKNKH